MDLDEQARPTGPEAAADQDISDEPQDFRFLQTFALKSDHPTLPRRGEKDFEPHGTRAQDAVLAASRDAMHDALALRRAHPPSSRPVCELDPVAGTRVVRRPMGQHFRTVGKADRTGVLHLTPEEALYLLERGSMELRLRGGHARTEAEAEAEAEAGAEGEEGLMLGLQSAYAMLLGREGLTLERFQVYAGLKRSGYIVMRAPGWDGWAWAQGATSEGVDSDPQGYLSWLRSLIVGMTAGRSRPMVAVGLYRSYADIYAQLLKIKRRPPGIHGMTCEQYSAPSRSPITVCYHVWKPCPTFKKSAPGAPDFHISVVSADADSNEVLSPAQLDDLLASVGPSPPPERAANHMYQRLRHGQRHVILAIVNQGVASYLRVADSDFGRELLYMSKAPGKGGKKKGWSGRGKKEQG